MTETEAQRVLDSVKHDLKAADPSDDQKSPFLCVATAARYLRGYSDETKAARNMVATHRYRQVIRADALGMNEESYQIVWKELRKRSLFIGAVSDGSNPPSPIVMLRKKAERFEKEDFEDYRSAFFFTLACVAQIADRQLAIEDPVLAQTGQWVLVMDMSGYSSKNSPPLNVSMETMRIFQNHFPERAKRIIVLDAPFAFQVLWKVLRPFIDPVTRPKFVFVSRSDGEENLKTQLGEKVWECINVDLEEVVEQEGVEMLYPKLKVFEKRLQSMKIWLDATFLGHVTTM